MDFLLALLSSFYLCFPMSSTRFLFFSFNLKIYIPQGCEKAKTEKVFALIVQKNVYRSFKRKTNRRIRRGERMMILNDDKAIDINFFFLHYLIFIVFLKKRTRSLLSCEKISLVSLSIRIETF